MGIQVLSLTDVFDRLNKAEHPYKKNYFAMYSSFFGGIITDPHGMVVPVDDHMVHRGDGVFEAIKIVQSRIYALDLHLKRLARSMNAIGMPAPKLPAEMKDIVIETARAAQQPEGVIRLFISRGPGDFTTNPYETIGSQMYVVITNLKHPSEAQLKKGVKIGLSKIAVKPGYFATVKSCNYLPNVLMKKEALDSNLDFTISLDEQGYIAEGSTENVGCVTQDNELVIPPFERTLQGITVSRTLELAKKLVKEGVLKGIANRSLKLEEFKAAKEIHIYGTTADAIPVGQFDGRTLTDFTVCYKIRELIAQDLFNPEHSTAI